MTHPVGVSSGETAVAQPVPTEGGEDAVQPQPFRVTAPAIYAIAQKAVW